jgi:hypothetical protein
MLHLKSGNIGTAACIGRIFSGMGGKRIVELIPTLLIIGVVGVAGYLLLMRSGVIAERVALEVPASAAEPAREPRELKIVTVLPKDAIPSIDDPKFLSAAEAGEQLHPQEQVLAVSIGGDHRAYPTAMLSSHEIVNDVVGGVPIAVTW